MVTHNSAGVLPGLLESLDGALRPLTWRLVLVDNDSADDSVEVVAREPGGGARREIARFTPGDVLTRTAIRIDEAALSAAHDQWRQAALTRDQLSDLATPGDFDRAAAHVTPADIASCSFAGSCIDSRSRPRAASSTPE